MQMWTDLLFSMEERYARSLLQVFIVPCSHSFLSSLRAHFGTAAAPVTHQFDMRWNVILRSVDPCELYCCKVFWPRLANETYNLHDLDSYETHFTVNNYRSGGGVHNLLPPEFIPLFEEQYPHLKWADVHVSIVLSSPPLYVQIYRSESVVCLFILISQRTVVL